MVNQTSSHATNVFGQTVSTCIGCGAYTASVDEVCEVCEEDGVSRDLILMEQEFLSDIEAEKDYYNSLDAREDF